MDMLEYELLEEPMIDDAASEPTPVPSPARGRTTTLVYAGLGVLGALAVALIVGLAVLLTNTESATDSAPPVPALEVNQPAPDFMLRTLGGDRVRLSEMRGSPVWLNFWASWCNPCREEMPDIARVTKAEPGVRLLTINTGESESLARGFVERIGNPDLPVALDPDGAVAARYGVVNMPTHVFIDSRGVVRQATIGIMDAPEMERALGELR